MASYLYRLIDTPTGLAGTVKEGLGKREAIWRTASSAMADGR